MSLKYPKSKLTLTLYQLTTKKTPTQGELVKFVKYLLKLGSKENVRVAELCSKCII